LREWLSSEQLAQDDAHNYFEVTGCYTGKRYRINHGVGMNIYELDRAVGRKWADASYPMLISSLATSSWPRKSL
jgi:TPP-dependent trihydroxycyclohexane-1,2-dione (THcHDO) dehydratase